MNFKVKFSVGKGQAGLVGKERDPATWNMGIRVETYKDLELLRVP